VIGPILSIRQPYASAVIWGGKSIENRSRATSFRGPLLVHAGLRTDPAWEKSPMADRLARLDPDLVAVRGAIIGEVELTGCIRDSDSPWAIPGMWHWLLEDAVPIDPIPLRGRLGLWWIGRGL
jgi:ASCH domain